MRGAGAARGALRVFHAAARGFGWLFLALCLAAAGAGLWLRSKFSPERARQVAAGQLQTLLRREVTIERLVLTPRGLKATGLRVRRGAAGGAGDLLQCDTVLATVRLRPLLSGQVLFDTVRFESPRIVLVRDSSGTWDLADLFVSTPGARGTLPLALAAAETELANGTLRVEDRRRGRVFDLDRLTVRLEGLDPEKQFPVALSFASALHFGTRTVSAEVSAQGTMELAGLRWSSATAHAETLTIVADGVPLEGTALVSGLYHPVVDFSASVAAVPPARWPGWTGRDLGLSWPASRWTGLVSWPSATRLEVERLSAETPAGVFTATGTVDWAGEEPRIVAELRAEGVDLAKTAGWHPSGAARKPSGRASARAVLDGWFGRFQVKEGDLSLRDFGAAWGARIFDGVSLDASARDEFAELKAAGTKGRLKAYGAAFTDIAFSLAVAKQTLSVESLSFRWGESKVRARGRVERLSAPKEVVLSAAVDELVWEDAQALVTAIAASVSTRTATREDDEKPWVRTFKYAIPRGFPDTAGRLSVGEVKQANFWCKEVELLWSLRGVTPALDRVGGEARLKLGAGRVADIPAVQDSHKLLKVIFLPFVFMHKMNNLSALSTATAYPKTLDFKRIEGEYALSKGVAATRYFHVDSGQLVAYAEGNADFGRERVDMNILTRLAEARSRLPDWWVDELGRPAIGFRVKGDLSRPDLEPRFKKIGSREIEERVDEGRARAKKRFEAVEKIRTL